MKVLYVARHNSGGADDEGAIAWALEQLGHEVVRVQERLSSREESLHGDRLVPLANRCDMLLFHKWFEPETLAQIACPKVFWFFDLVVLDNDPSLSERFEFRMNWMRKVTEVSDLGFCTDGDWVNRDETGKLVWLMQGIDERIAGPGNAATQKFSLLFTGTTRNGGTGRFAFINEMIRTYRSKFRVVPGGYYRKSLADVIAASKVIVAPDAPITDNYWSNRVYNTVGLGGFILHPYCEKLTKHFEPDAELIYYRNRSQLHELIRYYLDKPEERRRIAASGYERVLREHTYLHRCRSLIETVRSKLCLSS